MKQLHSSEEYSSRKIGTTGHEILDANGNVLAWTVDATIAVVIVKLLNANTNFTDLRCQ